MAIERQRNLSPIVPLALFDKPFIRFVAFSGFPRGNPIGKLGARD